ncbi:MAG: beta-phosphoglucomutase, partial [Bacteroides sp. SM23_62_1]
MEKHNFHAVIFDLDGVITKTALVHSAAWREMFNDYLRYREKEYGEPFRQFTHNDDYLPYVDGRPRYKGVESFLVSRGIHIPYGNPSDDADRETICGLGNKKNEFFNEVLKRDGVEVYESTVNLIRELKDEGLKVGVASSSKNCRTVLERAGLLSLFETRVDGEVSAELGLKGKPEPDIFTTACDNLGVDYEQSVIVEDAVSGVEAGKKGNFGLVLGIAREGNISELLKNGADIVVEDIAELGGIEALDKWFKEGLEKEKWSIKYNDYDPQKEKSREALLTVGNGHFATRGALEESAAVDTNYPGTYISGLYNRRISRIAGRDIENEDLVNCPNWLSITFRIGDDPWFNPNEWTIHSIHRRLTFDDGVLYRSMVVASPDGKQTKIESRRIASMYDPHTASIRYTLTPLNYAGLLRIRSILNGTILNDGVERYRQLEQDHLEPVQQGGEKDIQYLLVRTNQSEIEIAEAARLKVFISNHEIAPVYLHTTLPGIIETEFDLELQKGQSGTTEKVVKLYTSMETERGLVLITAIDKVKLAGSFDQIYLQSTGKWKELWNEADIRITGDRHAQMLIRLHIYHLLVTASPHYTWQDTGIPARGLHGEAYRGHIFWDELYILPLFNIHFPEITRSALIYRYRRLQRAREYARQHGYEGAMFPWQSGSDGREETQIVHLNPLSGEWGDDYSSLQRHISVAIVLNIWNYYWTTLDEEFMRNYGSEMFFEICRFWASKSRLDKATGKYSMDQVMGPDEFHEKYPGAEKGGVKDNAYTNIMVSWLFTKASELFNQPATVGDATKKINLTHEELSHWKEIAQNLYLEITDEGIIAQFCDYFKLKELDWPAYKEKYENIHRMDRILKAEGKSPDDYQVAKQADTLMTFYNIDQDEVHQIITEMGYTIPDDLLWRNFQYYIQRTSHGSTLSRVVHALLANMIGEKQLGWKFYMEALNSDYIDIQGGTTAEGIHAGVMGATVLLALISYAGINLRS